MTPPDERDELPVLMVITSDNYLVAVGDPNTFSADDIKGYVTDGYSLKNVKFKEYASLKLKWIYSKDK